MEARLYSFCCLRAVLPYEPDDLSEVRSSHSGEDISRHPGSIGLQLREDVSKDILAIEHLTSRRLIQPDSDLLANLFEIGLPRDFSLLEELKPFPYHVTCRLVSP